MSLKQQRKRREMRGGQIDFPDSGPVCRVEVIGEHPRIADMSFQRHHGARNEMRLIVMLFRRYRLPRQHRLG